MDGDGSVPPLEGSIADLVETERQIGSRVEAAEAEAERLVEAARTQTESAVGDAAAALEKALRALRESIDGECRDAIRAIEERAAAEAERYHRVGDDEVSRLAEWVVSQLMGRPADS